MSQPKLTKIADGIESVKGRIADHHQIAYTDDKKLWFVDTTGNHGDIQFG